MTDHTDEERQVLRKRDALGNAQATATFYTEYTCLYYDRLMELLPDVELRDLILLDLLDEFRGVRLAMQTQSDRTRPLIEESLEALRESRDEDEWKREGGA